MSTVAQRSGDISNDKACYSFAYIIANSCNQYLYGKPKIITFV